jgi:cell division protein FtsL
VKRPRTFLVLWTLAVIGATSAFIVHLALRNRELELGYGLGRSQARVARLREVKRVLELELASNGTPARVDLIAQALFKMSPPTADRIITMGPLPNWGPEGEVTSTSPPNKTGDAD